MSKVKKVASTGKWAVGDQVKHLTVLDWNVGDIVDVSDPAKPQVEFVGWGRRSVLATRLVRLTDEELAQLRPRRGARNRPSRPRKSLGEYRSVFLTLFPKGFYDPQYLTRERKYKVEASDWLHANLDQRTLNRLVRSGNFDEVAARAKRIIGINLVFRYEQMKFRDGLKDPAAREAFARALLSVLYGSTSIQSRMEAFMDVLSVMGAAKWTIATYFLFLAFPKEHLFVKPTPTKRIAEACGIELNYRSDLNWLTYSCALQMADALNEQLSDLKPRDMIDLQSFIWKTARS